MESLEPEGDTHLEMIDTSRLSRRNTYWPLPPLSWGSVGPGAKEDGTTKAEAGAELAPYTASEYIAVTATLDYLSAGRPGINF